MDQQETSPYNQGKEVPSNQQDADTKGGLQIVLPSSLNHSSSYDVSPYSGEPSKQKPNLKIRKKRNQKVILNRNEVSLSEGIKLALTQQPLASNQGSLTYTVDENPEYKHAIATEFDEAV